MRDVWRYQRPAPRDVISDALDEVEALAGIDEEISALEWSAEEYDALFEDWDDGWPFH